ncbi:alpha/beta hydrolase [Kocuria sp.]|uniref:alpha/beta hydrolase n=1 Tax=Kocuria sp. TaxID=1871328 RepID=UPI0026E07576|nr:alpha/beta fold hydrolase [Kocuria sp.]MDO5618469.1 alpha/beta fold hydrolase [Kocuria sp.]
MSANVHLPSGVVLPSEEDPRVAFRIPGTGPQSVGVVVIHGFTGSVYSVRDWALSFTPEHSVVVPALPGHREPGWEALGASTWKDWYRHVHALVSDLAQSHTRVVVAGFSMGGALALRLAETMPEVVDGVVLVNPALSLHNRAAPAAFVLRHAVTSTGAVGSDVAKAGVDEYAYDRTPVAGVAQLNQLMKRTSRHLGQVRAPVLVLRSRQDHVVSDSSHERIMAACSGPVETIMLPDSYHVATLDHDAPVVQARSRAFVDLIGQGKCPITGKPLDATRGGSA